MPKKTAKKLKAQPKKAAAHNKASKASSRPKRTTETKYMGKHSGKQSDKHSSKHSAKPKKATAAPKESLFERLLREKKERSEKLHEARVNQANHFANQQPHSSPAHLKFSRFAGPRRRVA